MEEGVSVNHLDIKDIATKLELLISDKKLREYIGSNGYNLVREFTWTNLAKKFKTLYADSLKMTYEKDITRF